MSTGIIITLIVCITILLIIFSLLLVAYLMNKNITKKFK
jgi:hypothetical protein